MMRSGIPIVPNILKNSFPALRSRKIRAFDADACVDNGTKDFSDMLYKNE